MIKHILAVVGIIIIVVIGSLATQKVIQQEKILEDQYEEVEQHCLDRGYLIYSIISRNGTAHRFCLSSDGILHVPNLAPNLVPDN